MVVGDGQPHVIRTCVEESALVSGEKDYTKTVTAAMTLLGKGESRVLIGTSTQIEFFNSIIKSSTKTTSKQQKYFQTTEIQIFQHQNYCSKQELSQ